MKCYKQPLAAVAAVTKESDICTLSSEMDVAASIIVEPSDPVIVL